MNKFNLKNFWREILIGILIALLLWISSADRPQVTTIGNSQTVCVTDTVTNVVPGATLVKYVKVKVLDTRHSTLDTFHSTLDTFVTVERDTLWLYADIPMNEYSDTSYYIRTIGWMDSISLLLPKVEYVPLSDDLPKNGNISIFGNTHLGNGVVAPGVSVSVRKLQLGYNYNVINQSGVVTVGYRIR